MQARERQTTNRRLNSWKEIASFFGRDERTVRRWEKERGLPIRRLPGGEKGGVFVFTDELSGWLDAPGVEATVAAGQNAVVEIRLAGSETWSSATTSDAEVVRPVVLGSSHRASAARIIGGVLLVLLLASLTYRIQIRSSPTSADKLPAGASDSALPVTGPAGDVLASRGHAANPEAEEFYLKGRYYWNKRTPDDLNRAVDYFTQAIVQDPNYSKAYVGLADCYNLLREYSAMPASEAYPRALAAARKAVELDDSSAEAHASLAFVTFYWRWDAAGAEREFQRAIALNPHDVQAHHWYATFLHACGREQQALAEIEVARNLEPSSAAILADKGQILRLIGQTDEAVVLLKQIAAAEPSLASAHRYLSEIYFDRKDYTNYLAEWEKTALLLRDQPDLAVARAAEKGFSDGGLHGMLDATLRVQKKLTLQGSVSAYAVAETYSQLGNKQDALQYLQTAYHQREGSLLFLWRDPAFDNLHDDSGYKDLVAQIGLPR
jgi:tetratricopeptide (TPR) repeat protein